MNVMTKPAASAAAILAAAASGQIRKPAAVIGTPRMEAAGNVEKLLAEVKSELGRVTDSVQKTADEALKQAKETGDLNAETKATADKALAEFNGLSGALNKLEGKLEALETRNLDLEQAVAAGGRGGGSQVQTVGQELAGSDELKAWVSGGLNGNLSLKPKAAITTAAGSGGGLIWPTEDRTPANMARQRLPIRALLMQATTESDVVKFARQVTRTNAAAIVAEEGAAPESSYGWEQAEANVRKISHVTHISDEALADSGQLEAAIDGEMRYGLDLEEEAQILAGDGTGTNLSGLITEATAFSAAAGLPDATRIDRLRLGMLQLALANYATTGITLNPTDWAAIELLKDTTGRYVFGDPNVSSSPMLWGADVVPTASHSAGEWMVGNFMMAATLYDRMAAEVLISSEHGTNFVDGMKTMKATKRLAMAVKRGAALVTGDFTFV
ncbi:phage major capsid protein [Marinibacterium profundimaris]|uniref:Capsid protein n=1 Tax=Marinibacterium profundimaris TaxID=1679460 RepID=A0A225NRY3_9RHOB|nr:phage major capsid protein [Marinibacterium profundimaris]OWU77605.1 capsid protein [Marinibacterium profundimaris]